MSNSEFCRPHPKYKLVLEASQHNYRPGMQQREERTEQASNVVTFVFFLQNRAGAARWPVSVDAAEGLKAALSAECSSINSSSSSKKRKADKVL